MPISNPSSASSLGLGTAATKDVGVSALNVVQLDADAKLPAVDGSALTNLPGGGSFDPANPGNIGLGTPSGVNATAYAVNGVNVVQSQQPYFFPAGVSGAAAGSDTVDLSALSAALNDHYTVINNIRAALIAHGLMAAS